MGVTRRASENPKGSRQSIPDRADSSRVCLANVKGGQVEDADARDGDRYDRNGLAMKRLTPAERRTPRLIDRGRGNIDTMQGVALDEH
jgi:hypothetical protein